MQPKQRVSGSLFPSTSVNGPLMKGFIEIDGAKFQIVIWENTSKAGNQYYTIKEDKSPPKQQSTGFHQPRSFGQSPAKTMPIEDMDDDIPF